MCFGIKVVKIYYTKALKTAQSWITLKYIDCDIIIISLCLCYHNTIYVIYYDNIIQIEQPHTIMSNSVYKILWWYPINDQCDKYTYLRSNSCVIYRNALVFSLGNKQK